MIRRILALIAGAGILVSVAFVTFGSVLVAPIGMWVAAMVQRRRGKRYSRMAGFIGAVLACSLVFAGLYGFALTRLPSGFTEQVQQQASQRERERVPSVFEQALRRASTASAPQAVIDKKAQEIGHSKAFIWWSTIVGGALAAGLAGLLLGSIGWAGGTLVLFGVTGPARVAALDSPRVFPPS